LHYLSEKKKTIGAIIVLLIFCFSENSVERMLR